MNSRNSATRAAFARRLRALRKAIALQKGLKPHQYTQAMMGESLGLLDETYRRYERGEAQPTLETLADIRRVTGISLDLLIAGEKPGNSTLIAKSPHPDDITPADRLRWAREAVMPNVAEAAALMRTDVASWERFERGLDEPPLHLMSDFAHRFGVSLDYLYRGLLTGVAPEVWQAVLALHPELQPPEQPADPAPGSKASNGNNTASGDGRPGPPTSVVVPLPGKR